MKTRSPLYLRQISDKVQSGLTKKATDLGIAKWLLVEKLLEKDLGIKDSDDFDIAQFLGINKNSARIGKPYKKKTTR